MYLVKSAHLKVLDCKGKFLLYNSLFGNPYVVDEATYAFLNIFNSPTSITPFLQRDNGLMTQFISQLLLDRILVIPGTDEREVLEHEKAAYLNDLQTLKAVSRITLLVSEICNFHCLYCYQRSLCSPSLGQDAKKQTMSFDTAQRAIEILTAYARQRNIHALEIGFNGGEALTNWNLVHKVLYYVRDNFGKEFSINWGLNTNASLVTPQIAKVLKEFDVHVSFSLDGDRTVNDRVRVTSLGAGTYDRILRGVHILRKHDVKMVGVYVTIAPENAHAVNESLIDVVENIQVSVVSLEPDFTRPYPWAADEMVDRIIWLRSLGSQRGIRITGSWERPFQELISSRHVIRSSFFCSAVAGSGVTITASGNIIPCPGIPTVCGTIWEPEPLIHSNESFHTLVDSRHVGNISGCMGCEIEGLCKGGCYMVNISAAHSRNTELLHQWCRLLKAMTRRLLSDWLSHYHMTLEEEICQQ